MAESDSQAQALKDARADIKATREDLNYYKGLAGMYQLIYDDQIEVSKALMIITGIVGELKNELNEYQAKNGQNERVRKAQLRINLMGKNLGIVSKVQTDNYILKIQNKTMLNEVHLLKCSIHDLKHQLYLTTLKPNDMPEDRNNG